MPESQRTANVAPIEMLDLDAQRRAIGPIMNQRIARVLEHGKYIMGPEVGELEEALAERAGVGHVVSCANGTDALQIVLMAWGIGPGDAVFVPSFTFTATAEIVSLLGATPIFCDVREDTYNLDATSLAASVEAVLSEGSLIPRVVIPVDLFGLPADYSAVHAVAERFNLRVLGDAAQSFGASQDGKPVGSLAEATATSFFPAKPLGCYGDGGAVFTDDDDLAAILRSLRVHGKGSNKYDTVRIGVNSRLDTIQAAVLLAKLTVFDAEIAARQRIAVEYSEALFGITELRLPVEGVSAWAQYTVQIRPPSSSRGVAETLLDQAGVPTAVYYPRALHEQPVYASAPLYEPCNCSADIATKVLSIPMHPYLSDASLRQISSALRKILEGQRSS
jgi:dTDP-4-amino-4,6-dideoxygalactose transaminase